MDVTISVEKLLSKYLLYSIKPTKTIGHLAFGRGGTGLVVRGSDSGSGDPGSILGRVGVLFPWARNIYSPKVLVIPRNRWLCLNMTEKLFTGMLNNNQNKKNNLVFGGNQNLVLKDVINTCKRLRNSPAFGGISSAQWRKVGRNWRLQICFHCLLWVRIEIDQL